MTLEELREQLQENLISYMDTVQSQYLDIDRQWVYDDICQVVIDTFNDLDFTPELAVCLDCGEPAQVCLCEE